jgi:hypothetical protein
MKEICNAAFPADDLREQSLLDERICGGGRTCRTVRDASATD